MDVEMIDQTGQRDGNEAEEDEEKKKKKKKKKKKRKRREKKSPSIHLLKIDEFIFFFLGFLLLLSFIL
jgi:hypothetical protein